MSVTLLGLLVGVPMGVQLMKVILCGVAAGVGGFGGNSVELLHFRWL